MINIIGKSEITDDFYRYKRPNFIIQYEGHNQNTKTIICNIKDISLSIKRTIIEIMKFYTYELGTSAKFHNDKIYIKGKFDKIEINNILHKYIQNFIICSLCSLPSTFYKIKKLSIKLVCTACGNKSNLDFDHKLIKYLLKEKNNINFNENVY